MLMGIQGKSFEKVSLNVEISLPIVFQHHSIKKCVHWNLNPTLLFICPLRTLSEHCNKMTRDQTMIHQNHMLILVLIRTNGKITINIFKHYIKIVIKFVLLVSIPKFTFGWTSKKTHVPFFIVILYIYIFMSIFKDILKGFFFYRIHQILPIFLS